MERSCVLSVNLMSTGWFAENHLVRKQAAKKFAIRITSIFMSAFSEDKKLSPVPLAKETIGN